MKLCTVGIHKWTYIIASVTHRSYRKCIYCNKHQVKDIKPLPLLELPIWWTLKKD